MYICCESLLVNMKKVKEEHIYEKFIMNIEDYFELKIQGKYSINE